MKIYLDMDGCLTDFSKQLADLLDRPLDRDWDFGNDPKIWKKIDEAGKDFWATMPWMPDGRNLWNDLKKHSPVILTSPSEHSSSIQGKKEWLRDNLGSVPYIIEEKKEKYAEPGSVLIDDREKSIKKWEDAGGVGILHKKAVETLKEIKGILSNKNEKEAILRSSYIVDILDSISNKLEKRGFIKQAYIIDAISDDIEKASGDPYTMGKFLESPMMQRYQPKNPLQEQLINEEKPTSHGNLLKKTLWTTGDPRLRAVKGLLTRLKDPRATSIFSIIEEAENIDIKEEEKLSSLKREALEIALKIHGDLAEIIGILFKFNVNRSDFYDDLREIKRLALKVKPPEKEQQYSVKELEDMTKERLKKLKQLYIERGVEDLSPVKRKAVLACIKNIEDTLEKWLVTHG